MTTLRSPTSRRPNVVVILLDTARADVFEPYGARRGSTPTVAELARRGSAAPNMYAPSSWTLPSHAAMFTGLTPRAAGLAGAPGITAADCRPAMERHLPRLLPEVMRKNGYVSKGVSCNMWITEDSGFATGFDEFITVRTRRTDSMIRPGRRAAVAWAWHALRCTHDDGAAAALEATERFLAEDADRPFFWFVNLVECHSPYLPPRPYAASNPITRVRTAFANRRHMTMEAIWRASLGGFDIGDAEIGLLKDAYDRSIRLLDQWIARLLETLDRAGVLDETLIVVTSDHGENFGDGRLIGHAFSLDDRLIRVPFIAAGPGAPNLERVASLVELPRVVASAANIEDHPWRDPLPEGVAVAQFNATAFRNELAVEVVQGWGLGEEALELLTSPQTAVTDGRYKLHRLGAKTDALFDLAADPLETKPLPAANAPERLRRALEDATGDATPQVVHDPRRRDQEDIEQRMKLLGYL